MFIALRRRAKMGRPKTPKKPPKWQTGIDNMSPWVVIGLAPLTQPWGLVAAGVATIMEAKLSSAESYIALFLFCRGRHSRLPGHGDLRRLPTRAGPDHPGRLRTWIDTHTDQVIIILSLGLGLWLVGKSIYTLVTLTGSASTLTVILLVVFCVAATWVTLGRPPLLRRSRSEMPAAVPEEWVAEFAGTG